MPMPAGALSCCAPARSGRRRRGAAGRQPGGAGAAAAQEASAGSYKALVCVFLYGGNDPYNTIVPYDEASHRAYAAARRHRAAARVAARHHPGQRAGGERHALRAGPSLAPLAPCTRGRLAVALSVGPLAAPPARPTMWPEAALPPSCSRTTTSSRTGSAGAGRRVVRLGRTPDRSAAGRLGPSGMAGVTAGNNGAAGRPPFLRLSRRSAGSTAIDLLRHGLYGSEACTALLRDLITAPRPHLMESRRPSPCARSPRTRACAMRWPPCRRRPASPASIRRWRAAAHRGPHHRRAPAAGRAPPGVPRTAATTTPACATTIPPCCANWARRWPSRRNWTGWGWPIR